MQHLFYRPNALTATQPSTSKHQTELQQEKIENPKPTLLTANHLSMCPPNLMGVG